MRLGTKQHSKHACPLIADDICLQVGMVVGHCLMPFAAPACGASGPFRTLRPCCMSRVSHKEMAHQYVLSPCSSQRSLKKRVKAKASAFVPGSVGWIKWCLSASTHAPAFLQRPCCVRL